MKTGCIQHPQNARLLIVHQWQVDSLNGDVIAAKLMSFFEYWHSHKLDELLKSDKPDRNNLIQHHTEPELEAALFVGAGRKAIGRAIKTLLKAGVIELRQNPRIPQDRTRHFLFIPEQAQALADRWNEVYQQHFAEHKGKAPICIPGNLSNCAIGQDDDCKTPNGRLPQTSSEPTIVILTDCKMPNGYLQSVKMTIAKCQMASCKTPNGVDPKITSEITPETTDPPFPPNGGILSQPDSKIAPIGQAGQLEDCWPTPDSPKPFHSNPTGEPKGSGEGKSSGRGVSQRKQRKPKGKTKQTADAYERRLELDPEFESRCDRLRERWAPFIVQLRGHYCDPQAFRRGYAWLISEWAGEHQMSPTEVEEGLIYYVESKLAQVQAGQQPTSPPDGIRFFTGKAEDSDHPTPYCWLALQRKQDRAGVSEIPVRRKKYGIDRQAFVERMRRKQA
ncbi:MAG: hypothetical protein F6K00_34950 [Leptolyngbya sp. SIOISBB]|nr:hypothetical protein [Leptolyngbya sp. SIOISBB]